MNRTSRTIDVLMKTVDPTELSKRVDPENGAAERALSTDPLRRFSLGS
ncbi:MAG: hypothetical protein P8M78_11410 [Myxococcota bacterium]|nr:hypothetical protein [Myxococcota bacterium]